MTPSFRLIAAGEDVTATLEDRLLSLRVTDHDGTTADRLELRLDNRDLRIDLPAMDARLELALGFRETGLVEMGWFEVEGLSGEGAPDTMRITATAVDLKRAGRAPRTRAFEGRTLQQIVAQIADDAGLVPAVAPQIAGLRWDYLAQTAESGLHFLSRLGREIDATVKAAGGRLVVVPRGQGIAADGRTLDPVEVPRTRLIRYGWQIKSREVDGRVEAEWADTAGGRVERVVAGERGVVRRLRQVFASPSEARRAATAARQASQRQAVTVTATLAFTPELLAGGRVRFDGLHPGIDGLFGLNKVSHVLDGGLQTEVEAMRPQEDQP